MDRLNVISKHLNETTIETNLVSNEIETSFGSVPTCPPDAILGVLQAYNRDTHPDKVNLSVGAYRSDDGKPFVLKAVQLAEEQIVAQHLNKEYLPQDGLAEFNKACQAFLLGKDHPVFKDGKITTIQTLSGTGAIRLALEYVKKFLPGTLVYCPHITWGNHFQILEHLDMKYEKYPYWNTKTRGLDLDGMLKSLENAPNKSVILLHACAHNPTGVDPTDDEWIKIAQVCQKRGHIIFMDNAYQGYASGDLNKDAFSIRTFASMGFDMICAQSFAKNFGLYGERIGALHFMCQNKKTLVAIGSQLAFLARVLYSNPPLHGARIVSKILSDKTLFDLWEKDLKFMSNRIIEMRKQLYQVLLDKKTPGDWSHIVKQIGMFTFTGLTPKQVEKMVNHFHIYMLGNGRISMAGLNTKNVDYVANAIHDVVTTIK